MKSITLAFAIFLGARAARLPGRESTTAPHNQTPLLSTTNVSTTHTLTQELERDVLMLRDDRRSCSCDLREPDDIAPFKWHFSPNSLLAVVVGVGGLVQPFIIVMFGRQLYSSHMLQMQSLPPQERNVFEHEPSHRRDAQDDMRIRHSHCVAHMSLQEKEELECEFDESLRPTTPPYSLTDVTLSPPQ